MPEILMPEPKPVDVTAGGGGVAIGAINSGVVVLMVCFPFN
jgi:hypothetical protein